MNKILLFGILAILLVGCTQISSSPQIHYAPPPIDSDTHWDSNTTPPDFYPTISGAVNPDITQNNINQTICNKNWSTKSIRPPTSYTNRLKAEQIANYEDKNMSHYEEDHLIPLELGGHPTDINNLWAEPYPSAYDKDKVENQLHEWVCEEIITINQAQKIISTDWYDCSLIIQNGAICRQ